MGFQPVAGLLPGNGLNYANGISALLLSLFLPYRQNNNKLGAFTS